MQEAKSFYQNLYSTLYDQPNLSNEHIFSPKNFTEGLDEQSKNECEGLLTDVECLESLKTMASNKSPGTDGLPAEFYKVFWDYVKPFLLNALNCSYTNGHLSGADLGGRCRGCAPPPPPPEMTCGFLIQLVFCKKKKKLCGLLVLK